MSSSYDVNDVLSNCVNDMHWLVTEGVNVVDPYPKKVIVFLDIFANVGDNPVASYCVNFIGHTAKKLC